jgi:hypothetical protein
VVGMPGIPPGSSVRIEVLAPAEQVTSGGR